MHPALRSVTGNRTAHGSAAARAGRRGHGLTLIELLVALAVMAVLAAVAYPSFRRWLAWQRVELTADLLAGALESARTIAASRRRTVVLAPLPGADTLAAGWRLLADDVGGVAPGGRRVLSVVRLRNPCLRIDMRASAGAAHTLRVTGVGYSRSERGGLLAATFTVRCDDAQRQVRLGAQGRLRICTPGRDAGCDNADGAGDPDP
ncbi:GspH/FimT family pseudopilin [Cupriavidus respiraculi]|uniref:GspH/FimT family pseudopilin n=1 Tax=Cupriavidus respiraculi TaxID=195930 RepID=UPI002D7E19F8|nr:GspH/FimT family pseudopilin [Cupriavidus respiraculi]